MKKPLHQKSEIFFSYAAGQITPWDVSDEEVIVQAANFGRKHPVEESTLLVPERMVFERAATYWLTRLLDNGVTVRFIEELNNETSEIRYRRLLTLDEGGSPRWNNIADLGKGIEPASKAAYAISHLIGSGAFQRLRRCLADGCDDFYFGPPNSKWCSTRCGSRARGRDKRKRDRARGVII